VLEGAGNLPLNIRSVQESALQRNALNQIELNRWPLLRSLKDSEVDLKLLLEPDFICRLQVNWPEGFRVNELFDQLFEVKLM